MTPTSLQVQSLSCGEQSSLYRPIYDIPGRLVFLQDLDLIERSPGQNRIQLPMQEVWGPSWLACYQNLIELAVAWSGRLSLAHWSPQIIKGSDAMVRQIAVGLMWGCPVMDGWIQYADIAAWWDTLTPTLQMLDQRALKF